MGNNVTAGLYPVKITDNKEIAEGVYLISWKRRTDFRPGQVVRIAAGSEHPPRIYSICSGNRDEDISVLYNIKPGGVLTPVLARLKIGDTIMVSDPYGSFSCDETPACLVATGTGIAPFYSLLRSGLAGDVRLIHGVRFPGQFYFRDTLESLLGEQYVRCCSREATPGAWHGRVTDYLESLPELSKEDKYYLCGQALMVVEVRDLLIRRGIPYHQIFAEIFF